METKSKNSSLKVILIVMTIGIWVVVLQNAGLIPGVSNNVKIDGGYVNVGGSVDVGNPVNIEGTVDVGGYVDVNIEAINGNENAFYDSYGNKNYVRIPVYNGN